MTYVTTIEDLERRVKHDTRQWGTPFEQRKATIARIQAEPRLKICQHCSGEQGYITILGLYIGCPICGGRGVQRQHWWHFHVALPPSFYEK